MRRSGGGPRGGGRSPRSLITPYRPPLPHQLFPAPTPTPPTPPPAGDAGFEAFLALAAQGNLVPLYERIFTDSLTPVLAYRSLASGLGGNGAEWRHAGSRPAPGRGL